MEIAKAVSLIGAQVVMDSVRIDKPQRPKLTDETLSDETWISKDLVGELPRQHSGWKTLDRGQYGKLARIHCGVPVNAQLLPIFRKFYDVLIIVPEHPLRVAVVEIKVVHEGHLWNRPGNSMATDYDKIRNFQTALRAQRSPTVVEGYIGGLVCDTCKGEVAVRAEDTIAALKNNFPGLEVDEGNPEPSIKGGWYWRFICAKMPPLPPV